MKNTTPSHPSTATPAVLYIRVSTDEQADHGVSLEAQEAKLHAYCELRGLEVVEVVVDAGVSASKPLSSRQGGQRILELVRHKQVQMVVALKLDRLFRDCTDCLLNTEEWDRKGVGLCLVDLGGEAFNSASALGRYFLVMMAGAAELERTLVAERTRFAMAHKKARGQRVGEIPYGSRLGDDGVTLLPDEGEQAVIEAVREARRRGLSQRAIVAELGKQGFVSRTGKPLGQTQIARILKTHAA